jgi:hypothetical protein
MSRYSIIGSYYFQSTGCITKGLGFDLCSGKRFYFFKLPNLALGSADDSIGSLDRFSQS